MSNKILNSSPEISFINEVKTILEAARQKAYTAHLLQ